MSKLDFKNKPQLCLVQDEQLLAIHQKATHILEEIGIYFDCDQALDLFAKAGCSVDIQTKMAKIPPALILESIQSAPEQFFLYNRGGDKALQVGGDNIEIVPSVSATAIALDGGLETRPATAGDLIEITILEDAIDQYRLLAPAVVCSDIPPQAGDAYRNYLMLKYTDKPFISEAWGVTGVDYTNRLLVALRGSQEAAAAKPIILIGLCPISPLKWSYEAAQNLIDAVTLGIPINICVCPMLGSGSPITIAGALVVQVAEFLSGLVLAQILQKGARVVFGSYTTSMDMKTMVAAMTAMEAVMAVTVQGAMARYYGVPSQTFAACAEAKTLDYQGGWETALTGLMAVQAGINLIYGAGSSNFLLDFSCEKLLMDAEIAKAYYFYLKGVCMDEECFALEDLEDVGVGGSFLTCMSTLTGFRENQCYFSPLVDRNNRDNWQKKGKVTMAAAAAERVQELLKENAGTLVDAETGARLDLVIQAMAKELGCSLPLVTPELSKKE